MAQETWFKSGTPLKPSYFVDSNVITPDNYFVKTPETAVSTERNQKEDSKNLKLDSIKKNLNFSSDLPPWSQIQKYPNLPEDTVNVQGFRIIPSSFKTLLGDNWLDDNIINGFF